MLNSAVSASTLDQPRRCYLCSAIGLLYRNPRGRPGRYLLATTIELTHRLTLAEIALFLDLDAGRSAQRSRRSSSSAHTSAEAQSFTTFVSTADAVPPCVHYRQCAAPRDERRRAAPAYRRFTMQAGATSGACAACARKPRRRPHCTRWTTVRSLRHRLPRRLLTVSCSHRVGSSGPRRRGSAPCVNLCQVCRIASLAHCVPRHPRLP